MVAGTPVEEGGSKSQQDLKAQIESGPEGPEKEALKKRLEKLMTEEEREMEEVKAQIASTPEGPERAALMKRLVELMLELLSEHELLEREMEELKAQIESVLWGGLYVLGIESDRSEEKPYAGSRDYSEYNAQSYAQTEAETVMYGGNAFIDYY